MGSHLAAFDGQQRGDPMSPGSALRAWIPIHQPEAEPPSAPWEREPRPEGELIMHPATSLPAASTLSLSGKMKAARADAASARLQITSLLP